LGSSTAFSEKAPQKQNPLSPYFQGLFTLLVENAYRTDYDENEADLALASFTALSTITEGSGPETFDILYAMLIPVLQLLEKTLTVDVQVHGDKKAKQF